MDFTVNMSDELTEKVLFMDEFELIKSLSENGSNRSFDLFHFRSAESWTFC